MGYRHVATSAAAICLAGVSIVAILAQQPQPSKGATNAAALRTPWGEPDLQGIWGSETLTPMQRPKRFADRPVLTPDEAKEAGRRGPLASRTRRSF